MYALQQYNKKKHLVQRFLSMLLFFFNNIIKLDSILSIYVIFEDISAVYIYMPKRVCLCTYVILYIICRYTIKEIVYYIIHLLYNITIFFLKSFFFF